MVDGLLYASRIALGQTMVVLTMRADFYGKCASYPELAAALSDHPFLVGSEIEPVLTESLVREVMGRPGALPLLQHTLTELWRHREDRRLRFDDYQGIGGLDGALERQAEALFESLNLADQSRCRQIFLRLVEPGEGTEDTKCRIPRGDLGDAAGVSDLIQRLVDTRLVTIEQAGDDVNEQKNNSAGTLEISHEALIRGWPRLRAWVEEDREALRFHHRLSQEAREWDREGRANPEGYVYRGTRLGLAEEWAASYPDSLSSLEREFLELSRGLRDATRAQEQRARLEKEQQRERQLQLAQALAEQEHQRAEERQVAASRLRRRAWLLGGAALAALLGVVLSVGLWENARDNAEAANEKTREANYNLAKALEEKARSALDAAESSGDPDLYRDAWLYAAEAALLEVPSGNAALSAETIGHLMDRNLLQDAFDLHWVSPALDLANERGTGIRSVAFSPNGGLLAAAHGAALGHNAFGADFRIQIWDAKVGKRVRSISGHRKQINRISFSPDGRILASAASDNSIGLWEVASGKALSRLAGDRRGNVFKDAAFGPSGRILATCASQGGAQLWDLEPLALRAPQTSKTETSSLQPSNRPAQGRRDVYRPYLSLDQGCESVALSPRGRLLAVGAEDGTVSVWDPVTGEAIRALETQKNDDSARRPVFRVTFSPDAHWLAASTGNSIGVWAAATGELNHTLVHDSWVTAIGFNVDGAKLLSGTWDGSLQLWDLSTGALAQTITAHTGGSSGSLNGLALSPDGSVVVTGSSDGDLRLWEAEQLNPLQPDIGHWGAVYAVAHSPDGRILASASRDRSVRLWDMRSGDLLLTLEGHTKAVGALAFSPSGRMLASGSVDHRVGLWDVTQDEGGLIKLLSGHDGPVWTVAFAPDGKTLASGANDGTVRLWRTGDGESVRTLDVQSKWVNVVGFSPDDRLLAAGSDSETVRLWDPATGRQIGALNGHEGSVKSLAFSPNSSLLASGTGSDENLLRLWRIDTGEIVHALDNGKPVDSIAFSPDGRAVAAESGNQVQFWDVVSGRTSRKFAVGCRRWPEDIALSPDGQTLAAGCEDKRVRVLDAKTGATAAKLDDPEDGISAAILEALAYSPDGRLIATWSPLGRQITLWDAQRGEPVRTLGAHGTYTWGVAFHPDGGLLAVGSDDHTFEIWDAASGELRHRLTGNGILSTDNPKIVLSPDGRWLATLGPAEKTLRIWDVQQGELLKTLTGHTQEIAYFAFSPAGELIATSSRDKTLRLWNARQGNLVHLLKDAGGGPTGFSPDGRTIASVVGKTVRLWDTDSGLVVQDLAHAHPVHSIAFNPSGLGLAAAGRPGANHLAYWDTRSGQLIRTFEITSPIFGGLHFIPNSPLLVAGSMPLRMWDVDTGGLVRELAGVSPKSSTFAADGRLLAQWGSFDNRVRVSRVETGEAALELEGIGGAPTSRMNSAVFSADQRLLAAGSERGELHLWELPAGSHRRRFAGLGSFIDEVALTPDGGSVISVARGRSIQVWDLDSGGLVQELVGHGTGRDGHHLTTIVFSPDGGLIASTGPDDTSVQLWDLGSGQVERVLTGHEAPIDALTFSRDGLMLASGAWDAIRLWDPNTGDSLHVLQDAPQSVGDLTFSPDASLLVSSSYAEGKVRVWSTEIGALVQVLQGRIPMVFNPDGTLLATDSANGEVRLWDPKSGTLVHTLPVKGSASEKTSIAFSPDGRLVAVAKRGGVGLWEVSSGERLRALPGSGPLAFDPAGHMLAAGFKDQDRTKRSVRLWPLDPRALDLYRADGPNRDTLRAIKDAAELLWERKLEGLSVVAHAQVPRLFPHNGYYFEHEDRFRPLLNPPGPHQSKFDQIFDWAVRQTAMGKQ